jgi:hypothetical protein
MVRTSGPSRRSVSRATRSIAVAAATLALLGMTGCIGLRLPATRASSAQAATVDRTCDRRAALARTRAFCASFDRTTNLAPARFTGVRFHVHQNVTDYHRWGAGDAIHAQHGADCGPPPATHLADHWGEYVFVCRNHLMTARAAPSYGATFLMPRVQADWSHRRAMVAWDVSTLSMSARDWIDVWITPLDDLLSVPIDPEGPTAYQGNPRRAILLRNSNDARSWKVTVFRDFREVASGTFVLPARVQPSATDRSAFEARITRDGVRFGMPTLNRWTTVRAAVPFTKGVVQWSQHSYNPTKDNSGEPATWHWDNFFVTPAPRMRMTRVFPDRTIAANGDVRRLRFAAPAVPGARLAFGAVCRVAVNFGAGWHRAAKQPASRGNTTVESSASYLLRVPAGARGVRVRFSGDGWYTGFPCLLEAPVLLRPH